MRMRKQAFEAMMKQEIGWFDLQENNTGALCQKLSGDASAIQGVRKIKKIHRRMAVLLELFSYMMTKVIVI